MRAINLILLRNNFFPPEEPWWISCLWSHRTDFAQAVSRESVCWHFATAAFTFKMYLMWNYWRIPRLRLRSEAESAKKREASNRKVTSALYLRWLTWFESRVHLLHSHNEKLITVHYAAADSFLGAALTQIAFDGDLNERNSRWNRSSSLFPHQYTWFRLWLKPRKHQIITEFNVLVSNICIVWFFFHEISGWANSWNLFWQQKEIGECFDETTFSFYLFRCKRISLIEFWSCSCLCLEINARWRHALFLLKQMKFMWLVV